MNRDTYTKKFEEVYGKLKEKTYNVIEGTFLLNVTNYVGKITSLTVDKQGLYNQDLKKKLFDNCFEFSNT